MTELTCIVCPKGCRLNVDEEEETECKMPNQRAF